MRMLAALLLFGGLASFGVNAAQNLKCCVDELREMTVGIQVIRRELNYSLAPLSELFQKAAAQTSGETNLFFADCASRIEMMSGEAFDNIWRCALENRKFCFKQKDYSILKQLGSVLGRYDADEQVKLLDRTAEQLEQRRIQAAEEKERMGRVYVVLGFVTGMFVLIALL